MLAIHPRQGSFSDKWIEYCEINNIEYRLVDCYSINIIDTLKNCSALMWHWHHNDYKAQLFARQLFMAVKNMGLKAFPDSNTCWHFDDKVGQKYLLEAVGAPLIGSYVFYDLKTAVSWIYNNEFPKVFKLRGGAGAVNVKLISNKREAITIAKKAFSKGFGINRFKDINEKLWRLKRDRTLSSLSGVLKGLVRVVLPHEKFKSLPIEKNYLYFQDFIPENDSDIRVVVIGKKAFAIRRMVRDGDFRASGSGVIIYDPDVIPKNCLDVAFSTSESLNLQCAAYDFVFLDGKPLIVEVSYGFNMAGYVDCPGFWDANVDWHEAKFNPYGWMVQDIVGGR